MLMNKCKSSRHNNKYTSPIFRVIRIKSITQKSKILILDNLLILEQ